ncbi:uncharacterized protein Z520_07051 [Fonsecaea multimorphosa CBS 102226]|uniref:Uncharacterized protein n=1 Tax=Fonsecaea multimorphosa CBS 102226 TaxID=1442371 RepID=A0A0D2JTY8_9EURO|nr:uncharacterized protein Z520_07051 [Fonsecaea multimorphosa CBS 102226]KIX96937.1 hypothetical protein Z520_07051 [Fonsecaea multimorphosa CBS 102226]OAL23134.1 hypothetical protein AYO22_06627 [Fonsecaea multimorphosa]
MSLPTRTLCTFLIILLLFNALAYAAKGIKPDDSVCSPEGPVEQGCAIDGNSDFYGLGVRIGIYTQWMTSWIANNFLCEEIIGSLETNSIFLLALFSTVFFYSVRKDQIRVVDVLVIHQLCVGFLFSIMSLWGYRTMYYKTEGPGGRRHFGGFGTHFRLVLMSMITLYGVWFWAKGIDVLSPCDRREACGGLQTYFFVSMRVESWVTRGVNLAMAIVAALYYAVMAIVAAIAGIVYVTRKWEKKADNWELIEHPDADVSLNKRELTTWYICLSCFNLFWIVFAILNIEFTLNLNHMGNVLGSSAAVGAGQLIPLAIGMISLVRVLYMLAKTHISWLRNKDDDNYCAPSGGEGAETAVDGLGFRPYSPPLKPDNPEDPNQFAALATMDRPPTLPVLSSARVRRQQKRSLAHRILLAWLPWLNLFEWSKESLAPKAIRDSMIFANHHNAKTKDTEVGFEVMGMKRIRPEMEDARQMMGHHRGESTASGESSSAALLSSPPQVWPGQNGLMGQAGDEEVEMADRRQSMMDSSTLAGSIYTGDGYEV